MDGIKKLVEHGVDMYEQEEVFIKRSRWLIGLMVWLMGIDENEREIKDKLIVFCVMCDLFFFLFI